MLPGRQLSLAILTASIFIILWKIKAKRLKDTAHVKEMVKEFHWLFGHAFIMLAERHRSHAYITERFEALGVDNIWFTVGNLPRLLTRDPQVIKHFLKDKFDEYHKGSFFTDNMMELLGNGIFTSDGEQWKVHRKTASHLFTNSRLKDQMTLSFCETADRLVNKCEELAQNENSVDMFEMFNRLTLEAFVKIAFGCDLGCIDSAPDIIPFMKAFDYTQDRISERTLTPIYIWKFMRFFNIGAEAKMKSSLAILDGFVKQLYNRKQVGEHGRPDLLSLFIDEGKRYNWKPPTYKDLKDIALNFVIAGRDTTAQTLTWVLYMLDKKPDVRKKVIEEVMANQGLSWFKRAEKMRYTQAVISETLRLFPIVSAHVKTAMKDDVLPNGFKIPAGTMIMGMPWGMGRNTKIWGRDARRFKPERWLTGRIPPDHEFLSFNAGRRTCLGKKFAYLEIKIVLAKFLQTFTYEVDPSRFCVAKSNITLPAREGLHCFLTKKEL